MMKVTRNGREVRLNSVDDFEEGDLIEFATEELLSERICGLASRGMYEITWGDQRVQKGFGKVMGVSEHLLSCMINIDGVFYLAGANKDQVRI